MNALKTGDPGHGTNVAIVMKMGNIVPRAGIEPTSHTFWASLLTITPPRFLDVTILPMATFKCGTLPERPVQATILE